MKKPDESFLKGRIHSLKYAFRGAWYLVSTEASIKVQVAIALTITIIGFLMEISTTEWMFQCLSIGLVLVAESLNTAIEKLCDFVHPEYEKRIGFVKDISAGAATFAAIIAVIVGLIIYLPKI